GRRRRDGDAVPALSPVARRLAAEARRRDRQGIPHAESPPLVDDPRCRRTRRVRAEVQASRGLGRAGRREAPGLKATTPMAALAGVATGGVGWGAYEAASGH